MIRIDGVPNATAACEDHADFLELCALRNGTVSIQDLMKDLRIGNAAETIADSENNDEDMVTGDVDEKIAQAAFDEIDERRRNFGGQHDRYPFELSSSTLSCKAGIDESLYTFLALLSWCGKDAGPADLDGEKVFEDVCARVAATYLGAVPGGRVKWAVFGFPRRVLPRGFAQALDQLCKLLGEGQRHHSNRPKLPSQKDAKLDIVAWIEFHDGREGKIITFGQCATGRDWHEKIFELAPPERWCAHWMADSPTVVPLRTFFVPHRIERDSWTHTCNFGGMLYDRCRIASLESELTVDVQAQWTKWSKHVLNSLRGL